MEEILQRSQAEELLETFESASRYVKDQGPFLNLSESDMLYFYGRYKIVTEGKCSAPKPGFFDLQGKRKWQAWMDCNDLDDEEAALQYIEKLSDIKPDWDKDSQKDGNKYWVTVSTMAKEPEEEKADSEKTIFDWLKENNCEKVKSLMDEDSQKNAFARDTSGLNPIHWAADRGARDIIEMILSSCPEALESRDEEGQTALHYASSCGHGNIVDYLKGLGSDVNAQDHDGSTPIDVAFSEEIKKKLMS